jgi:hypothetical protein
MENDTMILLLITISLFVLVIYNQFIRCDKEDFKNNYDSKRVSVITDKVGNNTINNKDLYKYNKIYRKNICLDNKKYRKKYNYKKKIEIAENEIDSLDKLLNNGDMKSLNNIDNNTLSDIETFVK